MKKSLLIIACILLLAFTTGDNRSEYNVPLGAISVCAGDLNLDGDMDIVCGHNYNWQTEWSGISILENNGEGYFTLDSFYLYGNHWDVLINTINNNDELDLVTQFEDEKQYKIGIIFDVIESQTNIQTHSLDYYPDYISIGDVSGNGSNDIIIANNDDFLWGIIYNDGTGNFSEPEYYDLSFHPIDISCGDLNNDGREDVVISGKIEVFFSYQTGFQSVFLNVANNDVEITDFDNDGDLDIVGSKDLYPSNYTRFNMIENIGNNTFIIHDYLVFSPICSFQFVVSDFNNDSLPDVLFHNMIDTDLIIFYNLGDFQLSDPQFIPLVNYGESYRKSYCADFDGNGFNDIATIRYLHATLPANLNVFFNDGKGNFVENPVGINETPGPQQQTQSLLCYPNPFSENLNFEFSIIKQNSIKLSVYDINGKHMKSIINKTYSPGKYKLKWNGRCKNGKEVKAGIYFVSLTANEKIIQSIKLIKK